MSPEIVDLNDFQMERWPSTPEGEERQADEMTLHYRTLLSHLPVEAITYWGISDNGAWLGAPVGFVRPDGSRKPSFYVLRDLIKGAWWPSPTAMKTDDAGRVVVRGFLGDYEISVDDASVGFSLDAAGATSLDVILDAG
jgi:hypothetical protein